MKVGVLKEIKTKENRVAMTPANVKNLAYYNYTHNTDGARYNYRKFKNYSGDFYARHVQQGEAVPLEIAAGVGRVPVHIVEYTDD